MNKEIIEFIHKLNNSAFLGFTNVQIEAYQSALLAVREFVKSLDKKKL